MHPNRCFVLMPFAAAFKNVYAVLKSVVEDHANCECVRADEIVRSNRITDDVYEQIQRARFLISDITGQNPNVYYELGLAHALDKEVIVLVQTGSEIPFDVLGIRYLEYSTNDLGELRAKLADYVRNVLQTVPETWRTELSAGGPDIRITRVAWPKHAPLNQPMRIRVHARNFGEIADTAYFSLSFPFGIAGVKILESSLPTSMVGEIGQPWKSEQVILDYPIAEASMWKSSLAWKPGVTHFLVVEVVPTRRGLVQFYISSSTFLTDGSHRVDPGGASLLDQRDEPVYCGIVEVA